MTENDAPTTDEDRTASTDDLPADGRSASERGVAREADLPGGRTTTADPAVSASLDRRRYLSVLGGIAGAGAAGSAESLGGFAVRSAEAAESAALADTSLAPDERIEKHRTGPLEVTVENPDGTPVEDAAVTVEQQSHDFKWGTAVHSQFLIDGSEWGEDVGTEEDRLKYEWALDHHFNTVVLENLNKWYLWEEYRDIADDAVQWAIDHGHDVRGHVCIWGDIEAAALPPRVVEAMGSDYANQWDNAGEGDEDIQYVIDESMNHIEEIIDHYGDDVYEWEVVNEVQHVPSIIDAISNGSNNEYSAPSTDPWNAPILGAWYEKAQEVAAQYDVGICTNTYNAIVGPYDSERQNYQSQIQYLVDERGIDLDGIGFQSHFAVSERLNRSNDYLPEEDKTVPQFNEYARLGARLRVTEFDMFYGSWTTEQKVVWMERYMRRAFSHPALDAFLIWGFWDPLHWGDELDQDKDAPMYDADWNRKPEFDVWDGLVFGEWWTTEAGQTDERGVYATDAFLGDHEIRVETDQTTDVRTVSVTDSDAGASITVTVDGGGVDAAPEAPDGPTEPLPDFGKGPWNDDPHSVSGEIPAEEFDVGGQNVGYYDETQTNQGGAFRPDAYVDIEETTAPDGTGYAVTATEAGEWLEYTTVVDGPADYTMEALVASDSGGGAFRIEADGDDVTGTVEVPDTGGSWQTVSLEGIQLARGGSGADEGSAGGRKVLRLVVEEGGFDLEKLTFSVDRNPYGGTPHAVPGTIEAEEFDEGGPGITYSDESAANEGSADVRSETAVDVSPIEAAEDAYAVGHVESGEWLEYTVDVRRSGTYALEARIASNDGGGSFHLEVDGTDVTGTVSFGATGGWRNWETVTASGIDFSAGEQTIRLVADDSWWDLDHFALSLEDGSIEGPPAVGDNENAPTDPDGDGLYEDVNGNGDGDLADAVDLFQHRDADEVTGNVSAYDFSGNDEVDLADVVQLFQENAD